MEIKRELLGGRLRKRHPALDCIRRALIYLIVFSHQNLEPALAVVDDSVHLLVLGGGDVGEEDMDRLSDPLSLITRAIPPPKL